MSQSPLTLLGILFKKCTGIKDISIMQKKIHKQVGQLLYHQKYTTEDVVQSMQELGMKKGSVVCIHAAMREFYNFEGTAEELIRKIQEVITDEGTLIMPAFPDQAVARKESYVFNALTAPTKAGHLAEVFRQSKNVVRSINVQHSACAWGKYAEWLTKDHQNCINCWDEQSPWFRMTRLNALVFSLGLPNYYIGTFVHCVEAVLYQTHPYWAQFFTENKTYRYVDHTGQVQKYSCIEGNLERRTKESKIIKYFHHNEYRKQRLSNLQIKVFESEPCLDKMIALGKRGITIYYVPSPQKYTF
jgi:aminoglycoside 3-N-acetyltransferase